MNQAQDSLTDQLQRVIALANAAGEYDVADWIKLHLGQNTVPEQHMQSAIDELHALGDYSDVQ